MTATALTGPHLQAKGYTRGRIFREAKEVDWLVIHTAEGATKETDLGGFFNRNSAGSSQAGIGQTGGYASYVNYADTCWAAPPFNQEADHLEICGFAKWTRTQWLAQKLMLETVSKWIAWRCAVRKIPIRYVHKPVKGTSGVTGHVDVNSVYHDSNHWDPGPNFPWDTVIARANVIAGTVTPVTPAKIVAVKSGSVYTVQSGDSYWKIAQGAYRDGNKWPRISMANSNKALMPGMKINVPDLIAPIPPPAPPVRVRFDIPAWPGYGFIAIGKHNSYIKAAQSKLRLLGYTKYLPSGSDGIYGKELTAAIRAFQKNKKLRVDGVFGPVTWVALDATR